MPLTDKQAYLLGLTEGVMAGALEVARLNGDSAKDRDKAMEARRSYYAKGVGLTDLINELDGVYSDRDSILIPIHVALAYCVDKLGGTLTNAQYKRLLVFIQRSFSSDPEKNVP